MDLEMSPRDLALFQFLLEGYGRLASITTIDPRLARVRVTIMPDFEAEAVEILARLSEVIACRRIPHPDSEGRTAARPSPANKAFRPPPT
ncbi:MAG: DUF4911 domain-containing protein [Pseudomonadota bacterium]|nr:DUF4911 domain-containing protein [Pseudomonadota bacterium]